MELTSKRASLQATFPLLYGLYARGRLIYEWFIRSPFLHGLMVLLFLPLLLPFTFILKAYNTPPPFVAMLLFNGIVEIAAVYYILFVFLRRRNFPFVTGLHILLVVLFIASALSTLFGFDFSYSFWGTVNQADGLWFLTHLYVYTFLLTWVFPLKLQWERILSLLGVVGFMWGVLAFIEIKAPMLFYPSVPAPQSLYLGLGNPGYLAHLLLLLLFPSFYGFARAKGWRRLFYLLAIGVLYSVLLLTRSATAVGLSTAALLLFALHLYRKRAVIPLVIGVGIIIIIIAVKSAGSSILVVGGLRNAFLIRVLMWKTLLAGFPERFFWGAGWQSALIAFYRFYDPVLNFFGKTAVDRAHNIIVEYLVTTGIAGTAAFISFWAYMLKRLYRAFRLSKQSLYFVLFLFGILNMLFLFFNFNTIIPYVYTYVFVAGSIVVLFEGHHLYPRLRIPLFLQKVVLGWLFAGVVYLLSMYTLVPLYQNFMVVSVASRLRTASDAYTTDYAVLRPRLEKIARFRSPYPGMEEMVARVHIAVATQFPVDEQTKDELVTGAKRIYRKLTAEHPWSPLNFLYLASLEQNPLESNYLSQAEALSPGYGYTSYYRGILAVEAKDYDEAYRRFSLLSKTNYPLVSLFYLGVAQVARGEIEEGESMIVSSLVPRAGFAWDYPASPSIDEMSRLLDVYRERGLKERFTPLLEQMVLKQPENSLLHKYLLLAYKESGKIEKVNQLVEFATQRFPEEKYLFNLLAKS